MKYFIPNLKPAGESETGSEPSREKLGGLPFGLPPEMYPKCGECGALMALLAQFLHHDERLNLGKENRILFVFQCNYDGGCTTWEPDSGANACFVAEPESLTRKTEKPPDGNIVLEKEYLIAGWQEHDDGISVEEGKLFLDDDGYDEINDAKPKEFFEKIVEATRLGGVPSWLQFPETPEGRWKFVGQLDSETGFNFGDMGIGYIFIEETENPLQLPRGKFLWQCS
jgi:uncharacterized protein YwqG